MTEKREDAPLRPLPSVSTPLLRADVEAAERKRRIEHALERALIAAIGHRVLPAEELAQEERAGGAFKPMDTSYFLARQTLIASNRPGMAIWREKLFVVLSRNTQRASSYFHLPSEQVVEIGLVLEI